MVIDLMQAVAAYERLKELKYLMKFQKGSDYDAGTDLLELYQAIERPLTDWVELDDGHIVDPETLTPVKWEDGTWKIVVENVDGSIK